VTVADHTLVTILGLQIGMLAEKVRDLGLDALVSRARAPLRKISVS
jgi:hypothetical protein